MVAGQINKGEIMSASTIRQQCLAVAQRFSAYLNSSRSYQKFGPEPLEQEDCDELARYIEDLVTQELAEANKYLNQAINDCDTKEKP